MALGLSPGECAREGMDALEKVGLVERADHRPREMSGGEQQRVAIARALINKPKIRFADEPTANLDSVSSRQILELFRKLFRDMGQTILMVTHEPRGCGYSGQGDLARGWCGCGAGWVNGIDIAIFWQQGSGRKDNSECEIT